MYSPAGQLSFWYASIKTKPAVELNPLESPPQESDARRARHMAEQIAGMGPEMQRQLLRILRGKTAAIPWRSIHPSWIRSLIREWPAQWRLWALESLPSDARDLLQKSIQASSHGRPQTKPFAQHRPVFLDGHVPVWWPAWFGSAVKRALRYPDLPPWGKPTDLPGSLWQEDSHDLLLILRLHGTSGLVACLKKLPRTEGQQLIWQLPSDYQSVATEVVQAKKWLDDPFWPAIFNELGALFPVLADRLVFMAMADWIRCGRQQGQDAIMRRLVFRLPRKYGKWMLQQLDSSPEWANTPVQPSVDFWKQKLQDLIQTLRQGGRIRAALAGETPAK